MCVIILLTLSSKTKIQPGPNQDYITVHLSTQNDFGSEAPGSELGSIAVFVAVFNFGGVQ